MIIIWSSANMIFMLIISGIVYGLYARENILFFKVRPITIKRRGAERPYRGVAVDVKIISFFIMLVNRGKPEF